MDVPLQGNQHHFINLIYDSLMQKRKVKEIFGASIVARAGTDLTVPVKKSRMGE